MCMKLWGGGVCLPVLEQDLHVRNLFGAIINFQLYKHSKFKTKGKDQDDIANVRISDVYVVLLFSSVQWILSKEFFLKFASYMLKYQQKNIHLTNEQNS